MRSAAVWLRGKQDLRHATEMEWLRRGMVTTCSHFPAPQTFLRPSAAPCAGSNAVPRGKELGAGSRHGVVPANPLAGAAVLSWWGGGQLKPCPADTFCGAESELHSGRLVSGGREIAHALGGTHSVQPLAPARLCSACHCPAAQQRRNGRKLSP